MSQLNRTYLYAAGKILLCIFNVIANLQFIYGWPTEFKYRGTGSVILFIARGHEIEYLHIYLLT